MAARIRHACFAALLFLTAGRPAIAQDLTTMSGVITTRADGQPVPGAVVSVVGGDATATTDVSGKYTVQVPGEFCSFTQNPADDQEYGPKWLTDVEASYRTAGYLLAAGVQNLFDVFPHRNATVNSFNGIQTFPRHSPFAMNGRSLYARVGWTS